MAGYENGYIKTYRKMKSWEWYKNIPVKVTFQHCLLMANPFPKKLEGTLIESGSFVTSLEIFAGECGLSVQQVRTSLKKLKSTHDLTYTSTYKGTLINVVRWADYQDSDSDVNTKINMPSNNQITNDQQTDNKRITTNKELKNKELKNNTFKDICRRVIENLNWQTGRKFKTVESNTKHIIARLNEGYSEEECLRVIHNKVIDWLDNPDMKDFLRPSTLFGTKFDGYLQGNDQSGMRTNAEIEKIIKESENPHE